MRRAAAFSLTAVLHAALLAAALVRCAPESKAAAAPPGTTERIAAVRLLPSEPGDSEMPACARTYRGIGITRWALSEGIKAIAKGGPADKAGLQVGDVILNDDELGADRYMVGHPVKLHIERAGRRLTVVVVIGRICFEENP